MTAVSELAVVEITQTRDHAFKAKDPNAKRKFCVVCGRGRNHVSLVHHGAPPSLNVGGSGFNPDAFQSIKSAWMMRQTELLHETGLPHGHWEGEGNERRWVGIQSISVEAIVCFPDRTRRDRGNFLFFLEKSLGDALVEGGWLPDDQFFPVERYVFGGLQATYEKGVSYTRLMLMPSMTARIVATTDGAIETDGQLGLTVG